MCSNAYIAQMATRHKRSQAVIREENKGRRESRERKHVHQHMLLLAQCREEMACRDTYLSRDPLIRQQCRTRHCCYLVSPVFGALGDHLRLAQHRKVLQISKYTVKFGWHRITSRGLLDQHHSSVHRSSDSRRNNRCDRR